MLKDRYSYAAIFSYDSDGICIDFPDLPGCCPCADAGNTDMALKNAKEALGLHIWGLEQDNDEIPAPTPITKVALENNQVPKLCYQHQLTHTYGYSIQTIDFIVDEIKKDPENIIQNIRNLLSKK